MKATERAKVLREENKRLKRALRETRRCLNQIYYHPNDSLNASYVSSQIGRINRELKGEEK